MGERNRAENCQKLLLNFNKNCLPELQWWFFCVLCGFLADLLRVHRVIVPPFALSFKTLLRLGTRAESRADHLTESGRKMPPRALIASKFYVEHERTTVVLSI